MKLFSKKNDRNADKKCFILNQFSLMKELFFSVVWSAPSDRQIWLFTTVEVLRYKFSFVDYYLRLNVFF